MNSINSNTMTYQKTNLALSEVEWANQTQSNPIQTLERSGNAAPIVQHQNDVLFGCWARLIGAVQLTNHKTNPIQTQYPKRPK